MSKTAETETIEQVQAYVKMKDINTIFVSMTEEMLMVQPENPPRFMVDYLQRKYADQMAGQYRKSEDGKWTYDAGKAGEVDEDAEELTSEDEEDDGPTELPPPMPVIDRPRRRTAVSAECQGDSAAELLKNYVAKVFPKTPEEEERIRAILGKNVIFQHLDADQTNTVVAGMFPVEHPAGAVIIQQGDKGDNFYLLDSGVADVYKNTMDGDVPGEPAKVFTYEEGCGAAFGELALLYDAPRAATVTANTAVKLWGLDRVSFKVTMMDSTSKQRMLHKSFIDKVPLLESLTETEKLTIADAMKPISFEDGDTIILQGDRGDSFFLIKEGEVVCSIKPTPGAESVEVLRVKQGGYFGEISLLTDQPRKATVTAVGKCNCVSLDRATFKRVMGPLGDILKRNMDQYNQVMKDTL